VRWPVSGAVRLIWKDNRVKSILSLRLARRHACNRCRESLDTHAGVRAPRLREKGKIQAVKDLGRECLINIVGHRDESRCHRLEDIRRVADSDPDVNGQIYRGVNVLGPSCHSAT
jgi:hypothetical protein